ncbi:sensor histidine kinase [Pseudolysinimonas sp.]|uniref:sensor histidine kinase n=1 Tax=Pseudolysinimonas sp. TaxID=2680009 RepID=UPI00378404D3
MDQLAVDQLSVDGITVILAAVAGALVVVTLVLLVLWRRARRSAVRNEFDRTTADRERLDLELTLAEQTTRLRVVRELHELAVHSVSVIISNADGARYAASQDPAVAARSASVIADTARHTLADLRRVMALSREGEAAAGPQPRLSTVRDLFKVMRDAGLGIEFRETGERIDLKQGAELAIYRILQEALENALAHGGEGTEALVSFTWNETGLEVLVADDGARAAARREGLDPDEVARDRVTSQDDDLAALTQSPTGRGMTEMRERAELYGGMLTASVIPGVGFTVTAIFPALSGHNGIEGVKLGAE